MKKDYSKYTREQLIELIEQQKNCNYELQEKLASSYQKLANATIGGINEVIGLFTHENKQKHLKAREFLGKEMASLDFSNTDHNEQIQNFWGKYHDIVFQRFKERFPLMLFKESNITQELNQFVGGAMFDEGLLHKLTNDLFKDATDNLIMFINALSWGVKGNPYQNANRELMEQQAERYYSDIRVVGSDIDNTALVYIKTKSDKKAPLQDEAITGVKVELFENTDVDIRSGESYGMLKEILYPSKELAPEATLWLSGAKLWLFGIEAAAKKNHGITFHKGEGKPINTEEWVRMCCEHYKLLSGSELQGLAILPMEGLNNSYEKYHLGHAIIPVFDEVTLAHLNELATIRLLLTQLYSLSAIGDVAQRESKDKRETVLGMVKHLYSNDKKELYDNIYIPFVEKRNEFSTDEAMKNSYEQALMDNEPQILSLYHAITLIGYFDYVHDMNPSQRAHLDPIHTAVEIDDINLFDLLLKSCLAERLIGSKGGYGDLYFQSEVEGRRKILNNIIKWEKQDEKCNYNYRLHPILLILFRECLSNLIKNHQHEHADDHPLVKLEESTICFINKSNQQQADKYFEKWNSLQKAGGIRLIKDMANVLGFTCSSPSFDKETKKVSLRMTVK